ncbi:MAG: hypothetical protein ACYCU7_13555 [Acidimicrobiales bacterium]
MTPESHGTKAGGTPITDESVEGLADEAERGYDVDERLRRRDGRPAVAGHSEVREGELTRVRPSGCLARSWREGPVEGGIWRSSTVSSRRREK